MGQNKLMELMMELIFFLAFIFLGLGFSYKNFNSCI